MIKALCDFCIENGAEYITADVAKLNNGSNAVLRKLGFKIEKEDTFKKSGTNIIYENYTYRLDSHKVLKESSNG